MNDVLIELQTRLEFQDKTIAELNDVITSQQRQIDELQLRLNLFAENMKELEEMAETRQENEKPPHY